MSLDGTTLIKPHSLAAEFLVNLKAGDVVIEILDQAGGAPPGLGIRIEAGARAEDALLALTPWPSLGLEAGQILMLNTQLAIHLRDATLSAEIDLLKDAPTVLIQPSASRAPALAISDGKPLLLAAFRTNQPNGGWIGFEFDGTPAPYYHGKSRPIVFDKWTLVLTVGDRRVEYTIG